VNEWKTSITTSKDSVEQSAQRICEQLIQLCDLLLDDLQLALIEMRRVRPRRLLTGVTWKPKPQSPESQKEEPSVYNTDLLHL
jgi:hypothetical protein